MDLKGSFIPLFRVSSSRTTLAVVGRSSSRPTLCVAKVYSSFGYSPVSPVVVILFLFMICC